jgi:hypothetical protein
MSSQILNTNISEIYDQGNGADCWIYSSVNTFMRFIIQVFKYYHQDKKFFEGKFSEKYKENIPEKYLKEDAKHDMEVLNYFQGMLYNINRLNEMYTIGLFRRKLLFVFLYGIAFKSKLETTDQTSEYLKLNSKERENMRELICEGGDVRIPLQYFINVLINNKFSKKDIIDIYVNYLLINDDPLYVDTINSILTPFNKMCNDNKLNPAVVLYRKIKEKNGIYVLNKNFDPDVLKTFIVDNKNIIKINRREELMNSNVVIPYLIRTMLNQGLYFCMHIGPMENESCIKCKYPNKNTYKLFKGFGHVMTCVGYDKMHKSLIIKNSYGSEWCSSGFFLVNSLDCIDELDLTFIYSNLPGYKFLPPSYNLFNSKGSVSNSNTDSLEYPSNHKKVVGKSYKDIISQYTTTHKKYRSGPLTIKKTAKRCPAGYSADKVNKTICRKNK